MPVNGRLSLAIFVRNLPQVVRIPRTRAMRILISSEVQQARSAACQRAGVTPQTLTHSAAYAVVQFFLAHFKFNSVCIVCGKGATGAIGMLAAAPIAAIAARTSVIILAADAAALEPATGELATRATLHPIWIANEAELQNSAAQEALSAELIIDAIAGADPSRTLNALERKAIAAINDAFGAVVSVDLPSGADPDSRTPLREAAADAVFAHGVIALVAPRPAHVFGELTAGPIAVSEIGVQPAAVSNQTELQVVTAQEVAMAFPPRAGNAHKGIFGHVLVIGGSRGKAGAAALAGLGALRAGAGLVTVACPASIQSTVSGFAPELMTEALPETAGGSLAVAAGPLERLLPGKDVVVLGPGISRDPETEAFVRAFVPRCTLPLLLDADALNAFEHRCAELKPPSGAPFRVLTPHPGEMAMLLGSKIGDIEADRIASAGRLAREAGACVVLKGARTIIAGASGETWVNLSGNPALAKSGSGDVLSGVIAAALARRRIAEAPAAKPAASPAAAKTSKSWLHEFSGIDPAASIARHRATELQRTVDQASSFLRDSSVAAAVHLHGLAGDIARDHLHENTVLARDVMAEFSEAFRECEQQMELRLFYLQK
jgi:hydroxyethylthiazole kinase-like uncharacterized protein yjeF